jgi:hypothetical protein
MGEVNPKSTPIRKSTAIRKYSDQATRADYRHVNMGAWENCITRKFLNVSVRQILFVRSRSVTLFVHVADMGNWEIQGRYGRPGNRREHDIKIKAMSYTYHEEGGRRFSRNCGTVKPTYKGTARDWNIFRYRQVIFIQVYQMWILGIPDPLDCKSASLMSGFLYSQVPFKTGLTVPVHHVWKIVIYISAVAIN